MKMDLCQAPGVTPDWGAGDAPPIFRGACHAWFGCRIG